MHILYHLFLEEAKIREDSEHIALYAGYKQLSIGTTFTTTKSISLVIFSVQCDCHHVVSNSKLKTINLSTSLL